MVSGSISRYTFNMNFFTHRRQLYKERSHLGIIWGKGNGALCYVRYFTPPKMLLFIKILYTVHTADDRRESLLSGSSNGHFFANLTKNFKMQYMETLRGPKSGLRSSVSRKVDSGDRSWRAADWSVGVKEAICRYYWSGINCCMPDAQWCAKNQ